LIREYLTANLISKPPALLEQAFEDHADDMEWWEILLMGSTISRLTGSAQQNLLKVAAGDAKDVKRMFLAVGMMAHPTLLFTDLTKPPLSSLIESLGTGVTTTHINAAIRIAEVAPDRLVKMLERLIQVEDAAEKIQNLITKLVENEIAKTSTGRLLPALLDSTTLRDGIITTLVSIGSPAVGHVLPVLRDSGIIARWSAVTVLGNIRDRIAVTPLLDRLHDVNPTVRNEAIEALGKIGDPIAISHFGILKDARAIDVLKAAANDDKWLIRIKASSSLVQLDEEDALEGVLEGLSADNPAVIGLAIKELRHLKQTRSLVNLERFVMTVMKSGRENAPLSAAMQDNVNDAARAAEAIALEASGVAVDQKVQITDAEEPSIEVKKAELPAGRDFRGYTALLEHPEESMRLDAVIALGEVDNPPFELVRTAVGDRSQRVRVHAMRLAGKTGRDEARQLLTDRLEHDEHLGVRMMAAEALGNFDDDNVRDLLRKALTSEYPLVEIGAAAGLAKLGDENMLARLADLAEKNDEPVFKSIAVGIYGELQDPASIPHLERLIERYQTQAVTPQDESNLQFFRNILDHLRSVQAKAESPQTSSDQS
jgi:HEAT repeat protein